MKYTLSVLVENHPGVLSKVSGLFARRGFNIDSLAVGITEDPAISRMTIVVNGDEYIVEQVEKQLNKVIPVIKVKTLPEGEYISRELSLVKVSCHSKQRPDSITSSFLYSPASQGGRTYLSTGYKGVTFADKSGYRTLGQVLVTNGRPKSSAVFFA